MPIFLRMFVFLFALLCVSAASAGWIRESNKNARKELRWEADFVPKSVTVKGIKPSFEGSDLQGCEADLALLQTQLDAYASCVRMELLPCTRPDSRLLSEIYANNLRRYGVHATPELLRTAVLEKFVTHTEQQVEK